MEYGQVGNGDSEREEAAAPAARLARLMTQAQNRFDVDSTTALRLREALMHHSELHSTCQRKIRPTLHCSTYQHAFLLPDGSCLTLWEMRHRTAEDEPPRHEVYSDRESLLRAEARVFQELGIARHRALDEPWAEWAHTHGGVDAPSPEPRSYPERDSPEHARRLLRRAENADRPGPEVLSRLQSACAHQIARLAKPCGAHRHHRVWCSVYEHAFLLDGGDEVSLFELEHNLTSDGQLVCEVYLDEATADQAADRYARAHGVDL